jgi:universal stress protein A
MGTHGRHGVAHLFVGSVTETVVRIAHCPVVSVRA